MRIESIYLRDVGPFDEVKIDFPAGKDPGLADVYLLTGPNGSGKSTVLYAIAALIGGRVGPANLLYSRARSSRSIAAMEGMETRRAIIWREENAPAELSTTTTELFDLSGLRYQLGNQEYVFYEATEDSFSPSRARQHEPYGDNPRDWAAFAYSGMRNVADVQVSAIRELTNNPLDQSLDFESSANSAHLAQWIANQHFRRLKAKEAGKHERAAQIADSIAGIEEAIGKVIGEEFGFAISEDDNDIRIRRNGEVVRWGVLPAGLQSIMSWIANLLMRLDRIPWVGNPPPAERSFLLLLDEIDIHLHPAWQRKIIPVVQKIFPKAQIIASTHSPFVVSSAEDAHVIAFSLENGKSQLVDVLDSQKGTSYSAVLKEIFGIESEFDVRTEEMFAAFREAKVRLLRGDSSDRAEVDQLAQQLAERSHEVAQIIGLELRQLERQLAQRATGA